MKCPRVTAQLSAFLDGELGDEAVVVAEHLAQCAACATARDELARMIAAARALEPPEPPAALWTRIDAHLSDDDGRRGARGGWRRWLALPSLAALGVAAVACAWAIHRGGAPSDEALLTDAQAEFQKAEVHYQTAVADLRILAGRERDRWPDERRRLYDQALAVHDATVDKTRLLARARTADPDAEEQLYRAYRHQIAFLEESLMGSAAVAP